MPAASYKNFPMQMCFCDCGGKIIEKHLDFASGKDDILPTQRFQELSKLSKLSELKKFGN